MPIDWGLARSSTPNDYLGPLQAMQAGRQAALDARRLTASQQALQLYSQGDLDGAQRTAIAGGALDIADKVRDAQARAAAGQVISQYGTPGSPVAQTPVQNLITAGAPAPNGPVAIPVPPSRPAAFQEAFAGDFAHAPALASSAGASSPPGAAPVGTAPQSAMLDHTHETSVAIGHAALTGQATDPTHAWAALYTADPAMGDKMMAAVGSMDKLRRDRLDETQTALANAAQSLLSVAPEQRAAAAQQLLPMLSQHGVTADMLTPQNLSDDALKGIVGQSLGVKGMLEQSNKQVDQQTAQYTAQTGRMTAETGQLAQAETSRHNAVEEGKGIQDGFGNIVNPVTGAVIHSADTGSGGDTFSRMIGIESGGNQFAAGGRTLTSPKGALGIAQLMPATARDAAAAAGVPFDADKLRNDPAYNLQLGRAYYQQLVQRFGGDEIKAAAAYNAGPGAVDRAMASGGSNWLARLPVETRNYVSNLQSGSARGAGGMSAAAIDQAAELGIEKYGGAPPPGYARNKGAMAAITNRIAEKLQQSGTSTGSALAGAAGVHADTASLSKLEGQAGTVLAFERTANRNADLALQLGSKVGNGNVPIFNAWVQAGRRATGNGDVSAFHAAIETFANEYAKVTSSATGGGTTSDSARAHANALINSAQSPDQLTKVIATLKTDMENRRIGLEQQRREIMGRIANNRGDGQSNSGNAIVAVNSPSDAAALASGTLFRTPDGRVIRKH